jgi:tRNA G18 (ribose-2'-O)-methylase SpoU
LDSAIGIFFFIFTIYENLLNRLSTGNRYFCNQTLKVMRKLKITEMNRLTAEAFKDSKKIPLVVVLDQVRSLNNVGSVFRTSDAFRVEAVYLCGITACPPHPEIHKTALGAEDTVDWAYYKDTREAVDMLKKTGYILCAAEQTEGSTPLDKLVLEKGRKYAVIFGNEVKGVGQEVVDNCDICVEIPQYGTKHSLNVSVSAGIVIWDFFKQLSD